MPIRANLLDLVIVNVWAFLVFCSFRGTVNVLGFVLMFHLFSKCMGVFVGFFVCLSEQIY